MFYAVKQNENKTKKKFEVNNKNRKYLTNPEKRLQAYLKI